MEVWYLQLKHIIIFKDAIPLLMVMLMVMLVPKTPPTPK